MLLFRVFEDGQSAQAWPLRNAYLIGADGNPLRAEITTEPGVILCDKREPGSAALCLLYPVGELGELTLQTTLLPDREEPYVLSLELVRHRVMLAYTKIEEWGLLDVDHDAPYGRRLDKARSKFIDALCLPETDPAAIDQAAGEALSLAIDASEELTLSYAEQQIEERKQSGSILPHSVGCGIALNHTKDKIRAALAQQADYVQVPTPWRALVPQEDDYKWNVLDGWADWAKETNVPVVAGPLICFQQGQLPDWIYIWEHDYETVRDLVYEHVQKLLTQYGGTFQVWNLVSGLHINQHFEFSFDQLMDLTRMVAMLLKKTVPSGRSLIEIQQPWGEYFGRNQRSIPPMAYVELIEQANLDFDAYAVRIPVGQASPGQFARDLMQVSAMLDQFAGVGKPLYVTFAAPSDQVTNLMLAAADDQSEPLDDVAGVWRRPWSLAVQSHWLEGVFQIAMSKPFVDAVAWQELIDHENIEVPMSGLITADYQTKPALKRFVSFRRAIKKKPEVYAID